MVAAQAVAGRGPRGCTHRSQHAARLLSIVVWTSSGDIWGTLTPTGLQRPAGCQCSSEAAGVV